MKLRNNYKGICRTCGKKVSRCAGFVDYINGAYKVICIECSDEDMLTNAAYHAGCNRQEFSNLLRETQSFNI